MGYEHGVLLARVLFPIAGLMNITDNYARLTLQVIDFSKTTATKGAESYRLDLRPKSEIKFVVVAGKSVTL